MNSVLFSEIAFKRACVSVSDTLLKRAGGINWYHAFYTIDLNLPQHNNLYGGTIELKDSFSTCFHKFLVPGEFVFQTVKWLHCCAVSIRLNENSKPFKP